LPQLRQKGAVLGRVEAGGGVKLFHPKIIFFTDPTFQLAFFCKFAT
jgi:hypothetical protein